MKKNLLYIGNKLSKHGLNETTVETLGRLLQSEGFSVFSVSDKKNEVLRLLSMAFSVVRYRKRVDFVLIDTYSTISFWYAFVTSQLCRFFKLNYIPILHGGNLPSRLRKNPKLCRMIFKYAYRNVAPSNYLKTEFEKAGFDNIVFIPNSIEIENYRFKEREKFVPKLLWVRAFASIYNPEMAVKVLAELQKTYPEATLTMVGGDKDGSMESTKKLAEKLDVTVTFTGRLSKAEWHKLSENHAIFINTTHFDNTPVSIIEAMALGLPVVSTNVGGIPFLLEDKKTAFLVEDNNVLKMSEAVIAISKESDSVKSIVKNARKTVESWAWNEVKTQWQHIFNAGL